ncbi:excinuclease ABC subunit UvrC [Limibacter armeniacum]|uniref:excinuclease ABC subunit UvrC n=1 Tax=Limibacter armeniacum TaxID=466084 RepID=UPI002FE56CC0
MEEKLTGIVRNLPLEPGVYKYFNAEGEIIYIGKAKALRKRVSSYFVNKAQHNRKTRKLVSEIANIEYVVVDSEYDALLLENNLIKENQPKYNILLKDDKTYPYICVTNERFPRVFPTRNTTDKHHRYYGPYASLRTMNTLLGLFRNLYKIRTCTYNLSEENINQGKYKVCLEYHIKNCLGPCEGLQSEADYQEDVDQIVNILKGSVTTVKNYLRDKMEKAAAELAFEEAAVLKAKYDLIDKFQAKSLVTTPSVKELEVYGIISDERFAYVNFIKITDGCITHTESVQIKKNMEENDSEILLFAIMDFRKKYNSSSRRVITNIEVPTIEQSDIEFSVPKIGDMKKLLQLSVKNVLYFKKERETARGELSEKKSQNQTLLQLKADLNLKELPRHIECFDNSNIQGTNPVAACVVFKDGKPSKKDYRHFNIKTVEGPNDFASMQEVVYRRYRRILEEEQSLPQLIIIDGGKGQLSSACIALKDLDLYGQIPIIGIAKRLEEIYFPGDQLPLHISKKSRSLQLIQRLRDEAHRFGITFHRQKRSNSSIHSQLEDIEGIGPKTIQKLLTTYKSVSNIKKASVEELSQLIGQKKALSLLEQLSQ